MSWLTVAICDDCWIVEEGTRKPMRVNPPYAEAEICHRCKLPTYSGIYVRREVK